MATLPVAPGANGQPPMPPADASKTVAPASQGGQRVRVAAALRVVQVDAEREPEPGDRRAEATDRSGHRDADRVGEHQLVHAVRGQALGQLEDPAGVDVPLERAAERDADRPRDPQALGPRGRAHARSRGEALLDARVHVVPAEGLGRHDREVHLRHAGGDRAGESPLVQHERGAAGALVVAEPGQHLLAAGHLRHAVAAHHAGGLHDRDAGGEQPAAELGAHARGERDRLVLEPVARRDVADPDGAHTIPSSRSCSSWSAGIPSSPV